MIHTLRRRLRSPWHTRRYLQQALAVCLLCLALPCAALSLDDALQPTGLSAAALSPDGTKIAAIGFGGRSYALYLADVDTLEFKLIVDSRWVKDGADYYLRRPLRVTWVGNDVLAVDYAYKADSIKLNGEKIAELGVAVIGKVDASNPDSPMLLVYDDEDQEKLALVNARTGASERVRLPAGKLMHWALDSRGQVRAVTMLYSEYWSDVARVVNWYRDDAAAPWRKLAEFGVADDYWTPMFARDQPHTLAISSRAGRDTYAVFAYDTETRRIGEMYAGHPTQDIVKVLGTQQPTLASVVTSGLVPQFYWFDPAWAALQQAVDAALPKRVNRLSGDARRRILIFSSADVDPGSWYLLDVASKTLRQVGKVQVSIDPAQMRPMETISYPAADGLRIPAFLTRPAGAEGPAPTVVMIHGGPTVRDEWEWSADVQVLAAHGYVVFQPQFRGSSGFGKKFEEAGFGQWGLAMQDDITAGVAHLIKQGIADPARICIYGASYGGYAALWGLAKTPDLYRCGISFAGVSDIGYMLNDSSDTNSNTAARQVLVARVGEAKQNREKFDEVSPLKHAAAIKAPVLLMHGEDDRRVLISHSKKMKRELDRLGKTNRFLSFEEEGHGLRYIRNQKLYFETLLEFLDTYIGPGVATPSTPTPTPAP